MLTSPRWTKEANTLFLVKVLEHGRFLYEVTPAALESNHAPSHAQGLLYVAQLFPEFKAAATWERYARDLLFRSMDAQLFDDGSHVEQSPNYAAVITGWLVETKLLDERNGDAWPQRRSDEADGGDRRVPPDPLARRRHARDRRQLPPIVGHAVAQGQPRSRRDEVARRQAALRDVWLFGPDAVGRSRQPGHPGLGDRAVRRTRCRTRATTSCAPAPMQDARQIIFDAGPKGGGHGHFDLLNFELFGYGRPLIADPGLVPVRHQRPPRLGDQHAGAQHDQRRRRQPRRARIGEDDGPASVDSVERAGRLRAGRPRTTAATTACAARRSCRAASGTTTTARCSSSTGSRPSSAHSTQALVHAARHATPSRDLRAGWIHSNNDSGGNVKIQTLLQPGQAATYRHEATSSRRATRRRTRRTRPRSSSSTRPAYVRRLRDADHRVRRRRAAERHARRFNATPAAGKRVSIRLNNDGDEHDVTLHAARCCGSTAAPRSRGSYSDIAYDGSGRLHLAYFDRDHQNLKYSVRDTNGKWSLVRDDRQRHDRPASTRRSPSTATTASASRTRTRTTAI